MGFIAVPPLAAAVSNAGGLGQLATGAAPPEILRKLISATRALTGRPFAVNFIIETTAFGPLTTDAVKNFQGANGMVVDGWAGDKTQEKLQQAVAGH